MFYAPKTVASMVAGSPLTDLYSDLHKDAIGCRPGVEQMRKANAMCDVEAAVEEARLIEWMREGERIDELRAEVARFDFSRGMQYHMRREGVSEFEAFKLVIQHCRVRPYPNDELPTWEECLEEAEHYGWEFIAMDCGLAQKDGAKLKEAYERYLAG
jgi:hypothetical protein